MQFMKMRKLFLLLILTIGARIHAAPNGDPPSEADQLAFIGLHGGEFDVYRQFQDALGLKLTYVKDDQIHAGTVDFSPFRVVFVQHWREEDMDQYERLFRAAKEKNPELRVISMSGTRGRGASQLGKTQLVEHDAELEKYHGTSPENLRRLLIYVRINYLKRPGTVLPPDDADKIEGLFHPDHAGMFPSVAEFVAWANEQRPQLKDAPRAVIAVHAKHLVLQQPKVVEALIRSFEARGILAVAMVDGSKEYEPKLQEFQPQAVIHTCHSGDTLAMRERLGVPHLHSIFFRQQAIDQWQQSREGLTASEIAFQVTTQELTGAIEPQIGAGTLEGGGSAESFTPLGDRIDHLTARAAAWMNLARTSNRDKKIAILYYNREMGKSELMRGSATGMFMNAPRSAVNVLKRMRDEGYRLTRVPANEDELLVRMLDHGQQIGLWAPGVLDRLARSGHAALIPVEQYRKWWEAKVPEEQRKEMVERWGPPPGRFLVWEHQGRQFIVVPKVDFGNVILLPQPLRGEAHDPSLLHDTHVPPPHNYLATYFWLQEEFGADAMVHFGTHGSEFALPGKPVGLSRRDWSDIVIGAMPNINPWVINNLGESSPVRRRAYAVLIDHLVPPSVNAELSDELANLHNDIDKWIVLDEGALKQKFQVSITRQVRETKLDTDLHLDLSTERVLSPQEIERVLTHLHDIHNETTPINLHVFGEPPREDLLVPYLVTCLRSKFLEALGKVVSVPPTEALTPGDRQKYLRRTAEDLVTMVIRRQLSPAEALESLGVQAPAEGLPPDVSDGFKLVTKLVEGFQQTHNELDQFIAALNGRFIPPGPGNSPDRNPGVLPTGRNMVVLNPEEVPSRASWELGCQLVDQFLAEQVQSRGRVPGRVGFSLSSFATFQDYGVMEAQILYLLGVRPVWDEQNLVNDVQLIPAEELKRPRIDVFIAGQGYYRDMLPTRMKLIDKAIRLVAAIDEPNNRVHENSLRIEQELKQQGIAEDRALKLSRGRIFGTAPGQFGTGNYYYLIERSGQWDSREELAEAYLAQVRNVYTDDLWGEPAAETYNRQIQGTEVVLRSWSDRTRSPLSNKYTWYQGGSLCLAVKHLTGKEPEFLLTDVRDPDKASMISAEDALRRDYRVRLFNRKWIEGMMKEGYAGADQIAVHVSNTLGWKIMRPGSVQDDIFEEIVDIYVRDQRNLAIREWLEAENPFAFQEMTEILLETIRKDYWNADEATRRELAEEYVRSVVQHGEGGGLRGGGNTKLEQFVEQTLQDVKTPEMEQLLVQYEVRRQEAAVAQATAAAPGPAPAAAAAVPIVASAAAPGEARSNSEPSPPAEALPEAKPADSPSTAQTKVKAVPVEGQKLEPTSSPAPPSDAATIDQQQRLIWMVGGGALLLLIIGFMLRRGSP
jgi:cobaltochelatase CobN